MRLHGVGAVCAFLRFRYVFHKKARGCEDRERCAHLFFTTPVRCKLPFQDHYTRSGVNKCVKNSDFFAKHAPDFFAKHAPDYNLSAFCLFRLFTDFIITHCNQKAKHLFLFSMFFRFLQNRKIRLETEDSLGFQPDSCDLNSR